MGMFDWYEPVPDIACPNCGKPLEDWQGKSSECVLAVWRQGIAAPTGQRVDEECKSPKDEMDSLRLPDDFELYTTCDCVQWTDDFGNAISGVWVNAVGTTIDGIWSATEVTNFKVNKRKL